MKGFRALQLDFNHSCVILLVVILALPAFAATRDVKGFGALGNGSNDDTAAIKSAIAALQTNDVLNFPCGTYLVSSGLSISASNITVEGNSCSTIKGSFSGGVVVQIGTGTLSSKSAILSATADLATSFDVNSTFASSLAAGSLVYVSEAGVDGNCSPSGTSTCDSNGSATAIGCEIDGCRGEVAKVASVSGTTVTLTGPLNNPYDPAANVAVVQKLNGVVSNVTFQNINCDGSGKGQMCIYFVNTDSLIVSNVTAQNVTGSAVSCGISGSVGCGWQPTFNKITISHAGGNGGGNAAAFEIALVGNPTVNTATIGPNLNAQAFGMGLGMSGGGTLNGITIDKSGTPTATYGRGLKNSAAARATYNGLTVRNAPAGFNGMDLTYYSHHMTLNNCTFSGNSTGAVVGFGNYNDYLTINNCHMTVGTNGALVAINQAASNNGRRDANWTINGGTYDGASGYEVIQIAGNNAFIHDATIGPATQGINVLLPVNGLCVNNVNFMAGMKYAYATVAGTTGNANDNTNNGNSVLGPLPAGACGGSVASSQPAPPTGLTAIVY